MSPSAAPVQVEADGAVTLVRMNLPDKRNALLPPLREALIGALEAAMAAPACRAIVLTGSGPTVCAGGDLDGLAALDPQAVRSRMARGQELIRLLAAGPKPVVAAVNGAAHGAGLSLAAACDFVVASDVAKFGAVFAKVGLMADFGLLWSLPRRIGIGHAKRLLYGGLVIDAAEAHALGLADELAAPEATVGRAMALARGFADGPPVAIALMRRAFARDTSSLEAALALELDGQTHLFSTEDFTEGRTAFRERRPPRFEGR